MSNIIEELLRAAKDHMEYTRTKEERANDTVEHNVKFNELMDWKENLSERGQLLKEAIDAVHKFEKTFQREYFLSDDGNRPYKLVTQERDFFKALSKFQSKAAMYAIALGEMNMERFDAWEKAKEAENKGKE